MSDQKIKEKQVRLRCEECDKVNYYKLKNKKQVKRKLELNKFCKWCRKHTIHKESKK